MKRDARIGLAVILVLGLSVTLLVARALHNRSLAKGDDDSLDLMARNTELKDDLKTGVDPKEKALSQLLKEAGPVQHLDTPGGEGGPPIKDPIFYETERRNPNPLDQDQGTKGNGQGATEKGPILHEQGQPPVGNGKAEEEKAAVPLPKLWIYTIAQGDNLWKIAAKAYGNGKYGAKIAEANPGLEAARMKAGQTIKLAEIPGVKMSLKLPEAQAGQRPVQDPTFGGSPKGGSTQTKPDLGNQTGSTHGNEGKGEAGDPAKLEKAGTGTYTVKSGDSLFSIAKRFYGQAGPKNIKKILDANPQLNPNHLAIGTKLAIPGSE